MNYYEQVNQVVKNDGKISAIILGLFAAELIGSLISNVLFVIFMILFIGYTIYGLIQIRKSNQVYREIFEQNQSYIESFLGTKITPKKFFKRGSRVKTIAFLDEGTKLSNVQVIDLYIINAITKFENVTADQISNHEIKVGKYIADEMIQIQKGK